MSVRCKSQQEFYENPQRWRARIAPLITRPGDRASRAAARAAVKEPDWWRTETVHRRYRLPLRRYISFRVFWDRLTPAEAEHAFYQALETHGGGGLDSDGEPTVMVYDLPFEQTTTGPIGRPRSASSGGFDQDEGPDSTTPACKRRRHSPGSEDEGGHRRLPAPAAGHSTPRPKAKGAAEKPPAGRKARASEDILANRAACAPEDDAGVAGASRRQVEMLKARSDLAKDSKALLDEVASSRSPLGVLQKRLTGMPDDQVALLEMDPKATLDSFNTEVLQPLRALDGLMSRLPLRDVQAKRAAIGLANPCHTPPEG